MWFSQHLGAEEPDHLLAPQLLTKSVCPGWASLAWSLQWELAGVVSAPRGYAGTQ